MASVIHGHAQGSGPASPEYRAWANMVRRCHKPKSTGYRCYGGRGITVCERWRNSFANFLSDVGTKPSPWHSLDRIDNNGNYEPGNVRWATEVEQARNRRNNRLITAFGRTCSVAEWAEEYGLDRGALYLRIVKLGWGPERALTTPVSNKRQGK